MNNPQFNRMPYPMDKLPAPLQSFAGAVAATTRSTPEMAVTVMLATMSAPVQGLVDVRTPFNQIIPTSLFVSVIAKSGAGKSSVLRKVTKALEEFERDGLNHPLSESSASASHAHHPFLLEDATDKGVVELFRKGAYSVFYAPGEGAILLKNLDIPSLCQRFDGADIRIVRKGEEDITLYGRRTSLCLLTQKAALDSFMQKRGEFSVPLGLMPRILFAQASEQAGAIPYLPGSLPSQDPDRHWFHQRIRELMQAYAESLGQARICRQEMSLDAEATQLWRAYKHQETLLAAFGEWKDVEPFLSRGGEQVLRVAAVLQYFMEPGEQVRPWAVEAAIHIVCWHLCEAKRLFGEEPVEMRIQRLAQALYGYLVQRFQQSGTTCVSRSEVRSYGPSVLRNADALNLAIDTLQTYGQIFCLKQGRREYLSMSAFAMSGTGPGPSQVTW
jgi:hypothetical protein